MKNGDSTAVARPSWLYFFGLFLVTAGMVILPILYVSLTALAIWAVYLFAVHDFLPIWRWPVSGAYGFILLVLCSCTPILAGAAVVISMVKPFFARRKARAQPLALDPGVEPRIYDLAARVSEIVGSAKPKRIEVSCDVNASASFSRGLRGFFGDELVLTLGMPLIAGLTERQLAGVIAHEFGHFRQGAGMRLTFVVRRVNHWFGRVVHERDGWDEMIESTAASATGWMAIMMGFIRVAISLARGILWMLMTVGHALCGVLLRQMEFDADRWEIRVSGSADFEQTTLRIFTLASVLREIDREMRRIWRKQLQLPDNLPLLVEYRTLKLSEEKRRKIENEVGLKKMGWLETHPSPAARVRQARVLSEAGLITGDAPARQLFENFDTISRLVTLAHYEDNLNVPTTPDFLIPIEKLLQAEMNPPKPVAPKPMPMMAYDPSGFRKPKGNDEPSP